MDIISFLSDRLPFILGVTACLAIVAVLNLIAHRLRTASRRQEAIDECLNLVSCARRAVRDRDSKAHRMAAIHMRRVNHLLEAHGLTLADISLSASEAKRLENGSPDDFFAKDDEPLEL